jgi:hypothetical protein
MIKVKGKTLPKIPVKGRVLDRVDGAVVADALGAELTDAKASRQQGPVALFGLRQALAERLRSTGGRPSLGVSRRQKIPLDEADWELLCRIAELLSDEGVNPTPGQVASELLRQRLHQVSEEIEHEGRDQLRKTLGVDTEKRRATG